MKVLTPTKHLVIAGAGYAGLPCALRFKPWLAKHRDRLRVSLVNPEPRQELTCDLYRTLRTGRSESLALPKLLQGSGVDFVEGRVESLDLARRTLSIRAEARTEVPYDFLVMATGTRIVVPRIEGLGNRLQPPSGEPRRVHTFKSNVDAQNLRLALKRMAWGPTATTEDGRDRFVVVLGAGATGIEVAGEIAAMRERNPSLRVILMDRMTDLLPDFSPIARRVLKQELAKLRIETILGSAVVRVEDRELCTELGQVVPWDLLVLCTGVQRKPDLVGAFGPSLDLAPPVDSHLQVVGHPGHFLIGDAAAIPGAALRAQLAFQQGRYVADFIQRGLEDRPPPGEYPGYTAADMGCLVALGPHSGVGRIGARKESALGRWLSPFVFGPPVNRMKWAVKRKYLLQLRTGL